MSPAQDSTGSDSATHKSVFSVQTWRYGVSLLGKNGLREGFVDQATPLYPPLVRGEAERGPSRTAIRRDRRRYPLLVRGDGKCATHEYVFSVQTSRYRVPVLGKEGLREGCMNQATPLYPLPKERGGCEESNVRIIS